MHQSYWEEWIFNAAQQFDYDITDVYFNEGKIYIANPYDDYQKHTQANISNTITQLDFDPKVSLEEGIKTYITEIKDLHGVNCS